MSVINDTSTPNAVKGAPSLFFNVFFKWRLCETNNELKALVHAWILANVPAIRIPPIIYSAKRSPLLDIENEIDFHREFDLVLLKILLCNILFGASMAHQNNQNRCKGYQS